MDINPARDTYLDLVRAFPPRRNEARLRLAEPSYEFAKLLVIQARDVLDSDVNHEDSPDRPETCSPLR